MRNIQWTRLVAAHTVRERHSRSVRGACAVARLCRYAAVSSREFARDVPWNPLAWSTRPVSPWARFGAYLPIPFTSAPPADHQREPDGGRAAAGYRTAWTNETVGGKDPLVQLALLLPATGRMTFGTGIANIWARAPQAAHAAAAMLAEAYPGRLVLGLGVGYPQQATAVGREFGSPLAAMRDYPERMAAPIMTPAPA